MTRLAAVVLAAGGSARLGRPKQLVEYEGETLVGRAARAALGTGASPVVVVVGGDHWKQVAEALVGLAVRVEPNPRSHEGLASSVGVGVRAALADERVDAVLLTLVDQPLVGAAALGRLVAAWPSSAGIVASSYGDALGAPALVSREHATSLLALAGDAGAGRWLRERAATAGDVVRVPMDEAAFDVDTPDDVARLNASRS